jgi:hypothetical protein
MTKYVSVFILAFSFLILNSCASKKIVKRESKLPYTYNQLKLYDIDEMVEITEDRMALYKETNDSEKLYEVMTLILARPNDDNILERLMLSIRYTLDSNKLWEESVEVVVDNAVTALKDETTSAGDQISYLMVLQNLLVEFKPEFKKLDISPKFEQNVIKKVAKAEIEVSVEARREANLNLFGKLNSPSDIAKQVLEDIKKIPRKSKPAGSNED